MKKIHQMKKDKEDALLKKREEAERKVSFLISFQAYKDHQNFAYFLKAGVSGLLKTILNFVFSA